MSLCQLYDKPTLDRAAAVFTVPQDNLPSLKGYIRGLRFCRPPLYLKELSELLLKPELSTELKLMVMDTFSQLDARQAHGGDFVPRQGALPAQAAT